MRQWLDVCSKKKALAVRLIRTMALGTTLVHNHKASKEDILVLLPLRRISFRHDRIAKMANRGVSWASCWGSLVEAALLNRILSK